MDKKLLHYKLRLICDQLTQKQIFWSRRFRDWEEFDLMSEEEKLITRLEELECFIDDIVPDYKP